MKKVFFILLVLISTDAFAGCGKPSKCDSFGVGQAIGDKATDHLGAKFSCDQGNSGYSKVKYRTEITLPFPYRARCCDCNGSYDEWMKKPVLCAGLNPSITKLPDNAVSFFDTTNNCWSFMCAEFYKMNLNASGCDFDAPTCNAANGYKINNGKCEPEQWCNSDWKSSFNSLAHTLTRVGGCDEYRCIGGGFKSSTDKTCVKNSPNDACGGSYPGDNGITTKCPPSKKLRITKSGNKETYNCIESCTAIPMEEMDKCWRCTDKEELSNCLKFKGRHTENGKLLSCAKCPDQEEKKCWR